MIRWFKVELGIGCGLWGRLAGIPFQQERVVSLRRIFKNDNTNNNKEIILLSENASGLRSRRLLAGSSATSRNELTKNLIPTISMLCWKNCCIWNYQQAQETVLVTLLSTSLSTNNGSNEK